MTPFYVEARDPYTWIIFLPRLTIHEKRYALRREGATAREAGYYF